MKTQRDYEHGMMQAGRMAEGISGATFSLRLSSDFPLFGDAGIEEHLARVVTARCQAETLVRLLVRLEAYTEAEGEEARKVPAAERLAAMGGI